ncbi:hypothetical protein DFQ28_000463 [Apophysomyces sp. BC1034]|nr:hypothetical protein DFQ30_000637 [Apophysomyces sp. BC1015]KAG0180883.1 hypothetical protein DFQ29_009959 [Apophysomyces sp. BC1021]KAG0191288.1 hypothetical protein DFQ28_000463 [Apophysomyces sp. BC1034]
MSFEQPITTSNRESGRISAPSIHPLTTEEPLHDLGLEKDIAHLNQVNKSDHQIDEAIIIEKLDPNKIPLDGFGEEEEHKKSQEELEEEEEDEELWRTTEANRFIPYEEPLTLARTKSRSQSVSVQRTLLVFCDHPTVVKKPDRIVVTQVYGAGPDGERMEQTRKRRAYLVACDFSEESFYSMEWTMGTMMRDGDELHVVAVINREDNPEAVKASKLTRAKELKAASRAVTDEAMKTLGQMLLFDIKLVTYAIAGRVKDVLATLAANRFNLNIFGTPIIRTRVRHQIAAED